MAVSKWARRCTSYNLGRASGERESRRRRSTVTLAPLRKGGRGGSVAQGRHGGRQTDRPHSGWDAGCDAERDAGRDAVSRLLGNRSAWRSRSAPARSSRRRTAPSGSRSLRNWSGVRAIALTAS